MRRLKLTDELLRCYKIGGFSLAPPDPLRDSLMKGGGGSSQAASIDSLPVPLPAKPITSANAEVIQAEQDYAKAQFLKKSINKTVMAGETGGYGPVKMGLFGPYGPR